MLTVQCPSCGSYNDETAAVCYFCKQELPVTPDRAGKIIPQSASRPGAASRRRAGGYERPGCVTAYAALLLLGGLGGIFGFFAFLTNSSSYSLSAITSRLGSAGDVDPDLVRILPAMLTFGLITLLIFSMLNLFIGWGLWTMRNWARVYILVTQGLSILGGVPVLFFSIVVSKGNLCIGATYLLPLVVSAYIFMWFLENRKAFR